MSAPKDTSPADLADDARRISPVKNGLPDAIITGRCPMQLSPARQKLDHQLGLLQEDIVTLGEMVELAVRKAVEALKRRDVRAAQLVCTNDQSINDRRYDIEIEGLILIATQQPMARDLRLVAAILEINTELERIGDYAKGIARITMLLKDENVIIPTGKFQRMADLSLSMLSRALKAFVAQDADTALQIPREDDQIDALYNQIFKDLMHKMIAEPATMEHSNYVIWAAHNLERLADRVTNICERVVFLVNGEMQELDITDCESES
jgi:phosphate transport system protein